MKNDWSQEFSALVDRVQALTKREVEAGVGCKSQDGDVGIYKSCFAEPYWVCTIYSYIFGPHRHHEFRGDTPLEAVTNAALAFECWVSRYESEYKEAQRDE